MEKKERAYLFVLEVDPMEVGAHYGEFLPLHCTLMPWFFTDKSPYELLKSLISVFENPPLELVSVEPHLFGQYNNIPVHTLAYDNTLRFFHYCVYWELNDLGVWHIEEKFVGDGYRPHVTTRKDGCSFSPGSRIVSQFVYLIEALDAENLKEKVVLAKIKLGSGKVLAGNRFMRS